MSDDADRTDPLLTAASHRLEARRPEQRRHCILRAEAMHARVFGVCGWKVNGVWLGQEPGKALVGKLCAHVRPKCHPLLLDTSINSPATVRLNLFQIMLLAAMKLHCQVPTTSHQATIVRASFVANPNHEVAPHLWKMETGIPSCCLQILSSLRSLSLLETCLFAVLAVCGGIHGARWHASAAESAVP